jgi:lipopolysaccharide heptosyltransferase II
LKSAIRKIAILLPNWVGDLAMATPTLRALRSHFPAAHIAGICRPYLAGVLEGTHWLDELLLFDHRQRWGFSKAIRFWAGVRRRRLDVMVLLRNTLASALAARLSGAKRIVGYARRGRTWLLTDVLQPPREGAKLKPVSAVDYYLQLAYQLGAQAQPRSLELATLPADEAAADRVWRNLDLPRDVVILNTGGAFGSSKRWPAEHAAALARRIAGELGHTVLINCGPSERDDARQTAELAAHPQVKSLAGLSPKELSFGLTKACLRRARLVVTTDSGPRHLASALQTPTITLYGPIDPAWSENYEPGAVHLRLPLECAPCGKKICPLLHHRCMRDLTADLVFNVVARRLAELKRQAA